MFDPESLVGKPYSELGRGPDSFDCWGLVRFCYQMIDIELEDFSIKSDDVSSINNQYMIKKIKWLEVDAKEANPFDVIALKTDPCNIGYVTHVGIYIGNCRMVHALRKCGVVISRMCDCYWRNKIAGYYRPKI